ncbi:MAG TPA: MFS transporter [Candidatus Binataceae bacterium]|nr:MFS transporter [Candidatus Binataceae bacterium]
MTAQERQGWIIVAGLFATLLLVFGSGYNTSGVFVTPLIKYFGWSRAKVSGLPALLAVSAGFSAPLIGWLLDRIETRVVMAAGAIISTASFLIASRANSYPPMLAAYLALGVGLSAATLLPASMVIANWFGARRGIAMGITMSGTTAGGMLMTLVASQAIARGGWRAGYEVLAGPMVLIAAPLIWLLVRTRPAGAAGVSVAAAAARLPGLEVGAALRSRSFWTISLANFCFAFSAAGGVVHFITYLIGIGYAASSAAFAMSMVFGCALIGKIVMGLFADRIGGRIALGADFVIGAAGMVMLLGAARVGMLIGFVIVYGLAVGAPLALLPLVMAESLGLKRFGTLGGLTGLAQTAGAALGPLLAGRMFDLTGSYTKAFELFIAIFIIGAAAALACLPLSVEEARLGAAAARAA